MGFLVSTKAIIDTTAKISIMAVVDILKYKKARSPLNLNPPQPFPQIRHQKIDKTPHLG